MQCDDHHSQQHDSSSKDVSAELFHLFLRLFCVCMYNTLLGAFCQPIKLQGGCSHLTSLDSGPCCLGTIRGTTLQTCISLHSASAPQLGLFRLQTAAVSCVQLQLDCTVLMLCCSLIGSAHLSALYSKVYSNASSSCILLQLALPVNQLCGPCFVAQKRAA